MKIVVIGGGGLIGSKVVTKLRERGHQAVAASPSSGVNTLTREGLAEVLEGASVVIDVSNSPSWEDAAVMAFFVTSTRNLLTGEAAAGVGHHVALSVVGSDRMTRSSYFRAKIAQVKLVHRDLAASNDPRQVVTDPPARYYGVEVSERTLIPRDDAQLSQSHVVDWLRQTTGSNCSGQRMRLWCAATVAGPRS